MNVSQTEGEVSREVLIALRRIIRAIDIHSRRLSKQYGLTGPQLLLLNEIEGTGQMLVGTLAKRAHLSQATVTTVIDRLEAHLLVTRRRDDGDKRRVWVSLTEKRPPPLAGGVQAQQIQHVGQHRDLIPQAGLVDDDCAGNRRTAAEQQ